MVDQPDPPAASSSSQLEHSEPVSSQSTQQPEASPVIAVNDRIELLEKARTFLNSPQVRHEDHAAKRRFLADKGLNEHEISSLLQELVCFFALAMLFDVVTAADLASTSSARPSANIPATAPVQPSRPPTRSSTYIQLGSWGLCCATGRILRALIPSYG